MTMQELLTKFEEIKKKWLAINENDLLDLINIKDSLMSLYIEYSSARQENKLDNDIKKWDYYAEVYSTVDDKGKKVYTADLANLEVSKRFLELDKQDIKAKETIEIIRSKCDTIEHYIVTLRRFIVKD